MNRILVLLCLAFAYIVSYAHFPSPLAHSVELDSTMIYGDNETYCNQIKKYSELASKANDKEKATQYRALQAEFLSYAGQPEESLCLYGQLIDAFTDEISAYTRVSIICSATQTAIDLGIINEMKQHFDTLTEMYTAIVDSHNNYLSDYYILTVLLIEQYAYERDAVKLSDEVADLFKTNYGAKSPQYAMICKISGNVRAAFDMRSQASQSYSTALDIWESKNLL